MDAETIARGLSEAQKRALLKLPEDGSEIRWEDRRAETSLYAIREVIKGDPRRQIATTFSLTDVARPAIVNGKDVGDQLVREGHAVIRNDWR